MKRTKKATVINGAKGTFPKKDIFFVDGENLFMIKMINQ